MVRLCSELSAGQQRRLTGVVMKPYVGGRRGDIETFIGYGSIGVDHAEVMNLACLVGREREAQFERGVLEAANLFDNNFAFDYNGPWTPHNFVEIDLEL